MIVGVVLWYCISYTRCPVERTSKNGYDFNEDDESTTEDDQARTKKNEASGTSANTTPADTADSEGDEELDEPEDVRRLEDAEGEEEHHKQDTAWRFVSVENDEEFNYSDNARALDDSETDGDLGKPDDVEGEEEPNGPDSVQLRGAVDAEFTDAPYEPEDDEIHATQRDMQQREEMEMEEARYKGDALPQRIINFTGGGWIDGVSDVERLRDTESSMRPTTSEGHAGTLTPGKSKRIRTNE